MWQCRVLRLRWWRICARRLRRVPHPGRLRRGRDGLRSVCDLVGRVCVLETSTRPGGSIWANMGGWCRRVCELLGGGRILDVARLCVRDAWR